MIVLRRFPIRQYVPYLLFAALIFSSYFWSLDTKETTRGFKHFLPLLVFGPIVVIAIFRLPHDKSTLKHASLAYIVSIVAIVLLIGMSSLFGVKGGSIQNPMATVLTLFCLPGVWMINKTFGKLSALLSFFIIGGIIINSSSLAAVLGLLTALITAAISFLWNKRGIKIISALVIITILGLPIVRFISPAPFTFLRQAIEATFGNQFVFLHRTPPIQEQPIPVPFSVLHRMYVYDFVLDRISEKPILGWGFSTSAHLPGASKIIPEINRAYLSLHPHNMLLQVWVELGILGAIGLALIWRGIFNGITKNFDGTAQAALMGTAVSYFIISLTAYKAWASWWIACGFLAAALMGYLLSRARGNNCD